LHVHENKICFNNPIIEFAIQEVSVSAEGRDQYLDFCVVCAP